MKRQTSSSYLLALALACAQGFSQLSDAQDVTITIKKGDDEKSKQDDSTTKAPFTGTRAAVDVAILLDTSNSMDGLIKQAKSQLWKIVQQFADAKKNGQTPLLRVSVFEYGNTNLPASEGYVRQVIQLTDDLDKVSEALFALTTNGGDEYCGTVIDEAVKRLDWNNEPNSYKAIFIAGNEPFTQGSMDYQIACKKAIGAGIVVNTIHCGEYQQGISGKWQHGAELAEGEYLNIDQDRAVVHIQCPQDKIIIELNAELNKTYLWYGKRDVRTRFHENQQAQDFNASEYGGLASRAAIKAGGIGGSLPSAAGGAPVEMKSGVYNNVGRDLVDTYLADADSLKKLEESELPEDMQFMDAESRQKHIQSMAAQRAEIQQKIAAAAKERQSYLDAEEAKLAKETGVATLGDAVSSAVQKQLQASGFDVNKK